MMNRRMILSSTLSVAAVSCLGNPGSYRKALISGLPTEESLQPIKAAGFDGIECNVWDVTADEALKARAVADKMGIKVHSVLRGWATMTEPEGVEESVASVEKALQTAQILGADAILLVPGRTKVKPVPKPWKFNIGFDEKTAEIHQVVSGDNAAFREYIDIQNRATVCSRETLRQLVPAAEKHGVVIAVENVWNNFWVKPDLFTAYIRSCNSPWIRAYLDIGNHVKYAPPEEWIRALGDTIVKCHVKDFQLNASGQGGKFVNIREGSVNWPSVMDELDKVGYHGWMTIEGSNELPFNEQSRRLNLILEGK